MPVSIDTSGEAQLKCLMGLLVLMAGCSEVTESPIHAQNRDPGGLMRKPQADALMDAAPSMDAGANDGDAAAPGNDAVAQVSFKGDVQPIFDMHCINCHSDEDPPAKLDLTA